MPGPDQRPTNVIIRQYQMLAAIKRDLIKQGLLTGAATPAEIIAKLRDLTPPDLFAK